MGQDQLAISGTRSVVKRVWFALALALALVLVMTVLSPAAQAEHVGVGDNTGHVVMLDTTDVGFGAGQLEASFVAQGKTVVKKTPAEWGLMTTAQFASYDAIDILFKGHTPYGNYRVHVSNGKCVWRSMNYHFNEA